MKVRTEAAIVLVDGARLNVDVGVHPDNKELGHWFFDEHAVLDSKLFYWFTESEFADVTKQLDSGKSFKLEDSIYILTMSNNNEPFVVSEENKDDYDYQEIHNQRLREIERGQ